MRFLIGLLVSVSGVITIALIWRFVSYTQTDPNAAAIMRSPATFNTITERNKSVLPTRPSTFADTPTNTVPKMADRVAPCRVAYSRDRSQEVMIVLKQDATNTYFSVYDSNQLHLSDKLDFVPDNFQAAKRQDGSILVLFADNKMAFDEREEDNIDKPLRIYLDDQVIYETTKVQNAGMNRSGSAWFAIEPQAGHTSRLIIGNIDSRDLHVYDIDYWLSASFSDETNPIPQFTNDDAFLSIGNPIILEETLFFPIDGSDPGYAVFPDAETNYSFPRFESAGVYYRMDRIEKDKFVARKLRTDPWVDPKIDLADREVDEIWSTVLDVEEDHLAGLFPSDDGRWLVVKSWEEQVLDRNTGEIIFSFSIVGNPDAARERLNGVSDQPDDENIGSADGIKFFGDNLIIERNLDDYRKVRDIFPIRDGKISHYPIRREPVEAGPCDP